ncbi:MAG: hypothetical protein ACREDV_00725 [Methylocella sp.]
MPLEETDVKNPGLDSPGNISAVPSWTSCGVDEVVALVNTSTRICKSHRDKKRVAKFLFAELAAGPFGRCADGAMDGLAEALGQGAEAAEPRNCFIRALSESMESDSALGFCCIAFS